MIRVAYDWKPDECTHCHTFGHDPALCCKKPRSPPRNKDTTIPSQRDKLLRDAISASSGNPQPKPLTSNKFQALTLVSEEGEHYASNNEQERLSLWDDLARTSLSSHSAPWLIGRDMNEVRYAFEKIGGRPLLTENSSTSMIASNPVTFRTSKLLGTYFLGQTFSNIKLQSVKAALKVWNCEIFGNVQNKVKHGRVSLDRIQSALHSVPQDHLLIREEHAARSSYLHLLSEEESFARQKSRQNFIQLGDRNTAYFYAAHAAHKASNTFRKVQRLDGSFSENAKDVRDEAIAFYQNLLNRENQAEHEGFQQSGP
ncbi:hypothetical protein QJS10_CPA07g00490 [Acorus calamus]|uniref:Uncharacterized protein n=1 Tax=Acorus calamus TaxID=4465 RepID=A0AAV9EG74_ACOCL|nr:hypothetical protein QJS10_CPA07g00490 [Acorus calamus]